MAGTGTGAGFTVDEARSLVGDGRPPVLRLVGRSRTGEHDAWRQLDSKAKARARRFMSADSAITIDMLAGWLGLDVDDAWAWWLARVDELGQARRAAAEWHAYADNADLVRGDLVAAHELVGPGEVAERLGVRPATVHQWRHRGLLPVPAAVLTSTPVWAWADVEAWALRTGRLVMAELDSEAVDF